MVRTRRRQNSGAAGANSLSSSPKTRQTEGEDSEEEVEIIEVGRMEDNLIIPLHGTNEVPTVEVDRWTGSFPLRFPDLKANLVMPQKVYPGLKGEVLPPDLKEIVEELGESIAHLHANASVGYSPINSPVLVQVLAKQQSFLVYMDKTDGKALVLGFLLVADRTGICQLTCINEAVERVYDALEIGDLVLLTHAKFQRPKVSQGGPLLHPFQEQYRNVEIKIEKYSVRKNSIISLKNHPNWRPIFPGYLFKGEADGLWSPEEVEEKGRDFTLQQTEAFNESQVLSSSLDKPSVFGDVIGVISYVGRLERFWRSSHSVPMSKDGSVRTEFKTYTPYRWIKIVDKGSKPLAVQIYARKENRLLERRDLVPGSIILVSHCDFKNLLDSRMEPFLTTSVYSMIYVNQEITSYLRLLPNQYSKKAMDYVQGAKTYRSIIARSDISWSVGGSLHLPSRILDPDAFLKDYWGSRTNEGEAKPKNFHVRVPPLHEFQQREIFHLRVRGRITRVVEIREENSKVHMPSLPGKRGFYYGLHKVVLKEPDNYKNFDIKEWKKFSDLRPCICPKCKELQWLSYPVNLPPHPKITSGMKILTASSLMVKHRTKYCDPLTLLPQQADHKPLCELKRSDPYNFLLVSIRDEESKVEYEARWSTYDLKEMSKKCLDSQGKKIVALISIFSANPPKGKEVILKDFVIDTNDDEEEMEIGDNDNDTITNDEELFNDSLQ